MRTMLMPIHAWAGAVLAAVLLIIAVTGVGLVFLGDLLRWQYPQVMIVRSPPAPGVILDVDSILSTAARGFGAPIELSALYMPNTRLPVDSILVVGVPPGQHGDPIVIGIDPGSGEYLGSLWLNDAWAYQLANLHFQLLAGEPGEVVVAAFGAMAVVTSVIAGLILWWPRSGSALRKATRFRLVGPVRAKMLGLHGLLGIWAAVFVVVWLVTGVHATRPAWFGPFAGEYPSLPTIDENSCRAEPVSAGAAVEIAQRTFPTRALAYLFLESEQQSYYTVTFRGPGDIDRHRGDGAAWVHKRCEGIVHVSLTAQRSLEDRIAGAMYSVHSGRALGAAGKPLILSGGVALAALSITGFILWWYRTIRPRRGRALAGASPQAPRT